MTAGRRVLVQAPATVANLGPGFDTLGLALDLANEVELVLWRRGRPWRFRRRTSS